MATKQELKDCLSGLVDSDDVKRFEVNKSENSASVRSHMKQTKGSTRIQMYYLQTKRLLESDITLRNVNMFALGYVGVVEVNKGLLL